MKTSLLESILPVRHQSRSAAQGRDFDLNSQQSSKGSLIDQSARNRDDGFKFVDFKETDVVDEA